MFGRTTRLAITTFAMGILGISAGFVAPVSARADNSPTRTGHWQWLGSVGGRGGEPRAFAQGVEGEIALGDDSGVSWRRGEVRARAALPLVRDLAFDDQGVLWIASEEGLYAWRSQDRPLPRRLQGGDASNRIHDLTVAGSTLVVATASGAFWSSDGRIFQPLRVATAESISHVAMRSGGLDPAISDASRPHSSRARRAQVWLFGEGRLSRVRGFETNSGLRVTDVRPWPLPRPDRELSLADLVIDPEGKRLHLVFEDLIAWRPLDEEDATEAGDAADPATGAMAVWRMGDWRIERPNLPPGAVIRRLGWALGRVWIASDHGLLEAESLSGPFRRSASPVGTTDCVEIQGTATGGALALCRSGFFAFPDQGGAGAGGVVALAEPPLPPDPPLAEIRRRALRRAGLSAERSEGLWERLRRRAWWPEVDLRFDTELNYNENRDSDQTFVSGDTRHLFDRARDEDQRYRAVIEFAWDLGGVVYPLESVDLSRELRQVVSLRDDVADEINQLYFERQSIREQLATHEVMEPGEKARMRWRAQELDAGLDAWTGGWISVWQNDHGSKAASSTSESAPELGAPLFDEVGGRLPTQVFEGPFTEARTEARYPGERKLER
jgi:hypothetical protein